MSRLRIFSLKDSAFPIAALMVALMTEWASAESSPVAVIKSQDLLPYNQAVEGFRRATRTEVIEYDMKGEVEEGLKIVKQIKQLRPTVVLAVGAKAAVLAKEHLSEFPLVYCAVIDPDKYGLQAGRITGVVLEIPVKFQLQIFKEVVPSLERIGVVYDPSKTAGLIREAKAEADLLGLELVAEPISTGKALPGTIRNLLPRVQGLWMVPDSTVITTDSFQFMLLNTLERNVPFMAFSDNFVKAGALLALSPDYPAMGKQSSHLVDEIVRSGAPVQGRAVYPDTARLAINLKTARILGLQIPENVLSKADEVFQ
jgi:putative ABC transport system substrate-binding protein